MHNLCVCVFVCDYLRVASLISEILGGIVDCKHVTESIKRHINFIIGLK